MSVRTDVAALLDLDEDTYRVIPYQSSLDRVEVGRRVVMLYVTDVAPAPQHQARTWTLSAYVLVPNLAPGSADDVLDEALDDVLAAIEQAPGLLWSTATRGTYDEQYPAYVVTLTVTTQTSKEN